MSRIPQSFIDDVLTRTDIVELIGTRLTLRKMGSNFAALCPFHQEKTASFTVAPNKQFFHCFGCGAHGNALGFIMQYERLEFLEALEMLAAKVGLELPKDNTQQTNATNYTDLYSLMHQVKRFYQLQLRQAKPAIEYLKSRGITGEIAKLYGLGYSPESWDALANQFKKNQEELITTGMLIKKNNRAYDRFRSRVIFPIRDGRGRVIGFGGRTLGDDLPKYLNSPETPIFHKGQELYGLYEARRANTQLNNIIIVEGYMDVIALAQFGITNAVATLGTATSQKHLQRLLRFTSELFFCFDGDRAGRQAAWRALEIALPLMRDGLRIAFVFLPQGDDPDSFVRREGQQQFLQQLTDATPLADFFIQHLLEQTELQSTEGKAKLAALAMELINKIPRGIFRQLLLEKLAAHIGMNVTKLEELHSNPQVSPPIENKITHKNAATKRVLSPFKLATLLLVHQPHLGQSIQQFSYLKLLNNKEADLLHQLLEITHRQPHLNTGALLEYWRDHKWGVYLAKLAVLDYPFPATGAEQELQGALQRIQHTVREQTIQLLMNKAKQHPLSANEKQQLQQLLAERGS